MPCDNRVGCAETPEPPAWGDHPPALQISAQSGDLGEREQVRRLVESILNAPPPSTTAERVARLFALSVRSRLTGGEGDPPGR